MSRYFERLLKASGLSAPASRAPQPPPPPTPDAGPPSAPGIVELHEESSWHAASPPAAQSRIAAPAPDPVDSDNGGIPPVHLPVAGNQRIDDLVTRRRSTIEGGPSISPSLDPAPVPPEVEARTGPVTRSDTATPAELPAEVMQSVMKWIAAGQSEPTTETTTDVARTIPFAAHESAPTVTPPAPAAREPVAERVIEIIEEHLGAPDHSPLPARTLGSTPTLSPGPAAPPLCPPKDNPVSVSIGSIHVQIEAPLPAPAPLRTARPPDPNRTASTTPPTRSSGLSRLRRHYFIPH